MIKFIKLTNNTEAHKGNPIYINVDHITAVYDAIVDQSGGFKTFVFGGHTGVQWEVEESPKTILKMIEDVQNDS
jgi:hypothetical protein